jgi:hypothetical protein
VGARDVVPSAFASRQRIALKSAGDRVDHELGRLAGTWPALPSCVPGERGTAMMGRRTLAALLALSFLAAGCNSMSREECYAETVARTGSHFEAQDRCRRYVSEF